MIVPDCVSRRNRAPLIKGEMMKHALLAEREAGFPQLMELVLVPVRVLGPV
jgi:hypothetical protein